VIWKCKAGKKILTSIKDDLFYNYLQSRSRLFIITRHCTIKCCTALGQFACCWLHKLTKLTREVWNKLIRGTGMSLKEEAGLHRPYSTLVSAVTSDLCENGGPHRCTWRQSCNVILRMFFLRSVLGSMYETILNTVSAPYIDHLGFSGLANQNIILLEAASC